MTSIRTSDCMNQRNALSGGYNKNPGLHGEKHTKAASEGTTANIALIIMCL